MSELLETLRKSSFGSRIAEDELDDLQTYFVETEQWRKVFSDEVDIVFGAKGSGKSAIYSLLVLKKEELRKGKRTVFIPAENPRGTPVFRDMTVEPPLSEEVFRGLWKLYFLTIVADYLRYNNEVNKVSNENAIHVIDILSKNDLLAPRATLINRLKTALNYIRRLLPTIEGTVTDPTTGLQVAGKITLGEPSHEQRTLGWESVDDLLLRLNAALIEQRIVVWLVLDRLDVAFSDSDDLEGNAIRSLFRSYLDMIQLGNIKLKVFLRDDIWKKVNESGFREASHVTKTIYLSWEKPFLMNLIVRRIISNDEICRKYEISREGVLANYNLQEELFYLIFPDKVDNGPRKTRTFDWMLSRTADGTKKTAPRELIHLLNTVRDEQLRLLEIGNPEPPEKTLFSKGAIRSALPLVSKVRFEQTLCAEFPTLKDYFYKLEGEKSEHSIESLQKIWQISTEKTFDIAEKCVEVGFFEKRGTKASPVFWTPFLYRDALGLIQGSTIKKT